MIITSVMIIIIEVASNGKDQYLVDGTAEQKLARKQHTVPDLNYIHTFSLGLLIPSFIYRVASKDCHEASRQGVGDDDGANDPRRYPKCLIWEDAQVQC